MFVNDEMLRNVLKAHKEPPKTARVADVCKVEAAADSGEESAREAVFAPMREEPKVMTQGELGI